MKHLFHFLIFGLVPFFVSSQTTEEKRVITENYNQGILKEIADSYKTKAEHDKQIALEMAAQNGWFVEKDENGIRYELMAVSEEGNPLYYVTNNVNAAKSTRANTLHNGGILGLNVEGQNMTAHVWDAGLARSTHQEYDGIGGSNRFSIGDGTSTLHYHSAHVTGTIMASGYSPNAKGMAPQAYAVGYDWDYDESEATTAASNGMLLSNHSYGWGASSIPDWYFGAYNYNSREWDVVMNNAPYYLMVCSAGNDGNDNSSNGDPLNGNSNYDKLSGFKTSKNNIVVANGNDASIDANGNFISVVISSGSSEGPTDDYRIKPDITGNGTSLYSTYEGSNSEYGTISGTSMASPNVCGTLLLLQQHYNNLNGSFMRAATLKGLALHTADDAGPAGPDVVYGWGLLNAKAAANAITTNGSASSITELSLSQGNSYTVNVQSDGINNLIASISWTDPAGTANTGISNNTTPVLVNDLDIRVTKSGSTYFPYKLTSITTNGTGDNFVDPFEKVIVPGASGIYTITVTHKEIYQEEARIIH
ncbi:MAG: S8 family serine peptidase [Bacteroidales bacterium]